MRARSSTPRLFTGIFPPMPARPDMAQVVDLVRQSSGSDAFERYLRVRRETERLVGDLSAEDQGVQSMPDASPAKWHRAHTTWFFEEFLLTQLLAGYSVYDPDFRYLFNS